MSKTNKKEKEKKARQEKEDKSTGAWNRKNLIIAAVSVLIFGIAVIAIATLSNQAVATKGDNVSIYYTMLYENGTVISTNLNSTPLEVTVGDPESIPGLSDAIAGMGINQKRTVVIPYDQAYGPYRSDLVRVVNRTGLIANTSFIEGQYFTIHRRTDNAISMVRILNITPSTVTWDENHPLAGQNLTFTVQVVSLDKGAGANLVGTSAAAVTPEIPASETIENKN
jgi:peptidylprolyl isomerase